MLWPHSRFPEPVGPGRGAAPTTGAGQRSANIHIRVSGRLNQRYPLLFRDYLRAHPSTAESYALVKVALAKYHADDVEAYYDVKDPVCDIIMAAAEEWAAATHWQPEPGTL